MFTKPPPQHPTISRVFLSSGNCCWLNDFGFPFKLTANALSDRNYYSLVSAGFQKLSMACGIEPCVLDAAIFASYDLRDGK